MKTNPAFVLREVGNIHLLVPARKNSITEYYLSLNEMGAWIWRNAADLSNTEELADAAAEAFGLSDEQRHEVKGFCESLVARGLVEV